MRKLFKGLIEQAVGHWKTTGIAVAESGAMVTASQTMSENPEVQKFAAVFAAIRLIIGLFQKDHQK